MHIGINAHTLIPPCTGVQQSLRGMIRALVAAAPEDKFSVYVPRGFDQSLLPQADNLHLIKSWIPAGNRTLRILWEQFFLHTQIFRDKIDILHAPCYVMPLWCLKPTVVTLHDLFAINEPSFCRRGNAAHYRRMIPRSVERAKAVIVPTNAIKREAADTFEGIRSDKYHVIPWGVDERFRPVTDKTRREEVALKYGLPPEFVLHVGRSEPKKNLMHILQAYFAATIAANLPHRLVLAGPKGWGVSGLDRVIDELGISNKVIRPGYIADEDLPVVYSMARVLLFPSRAEGFGLPVLEAMACGTPVIATNIPPLREVCGSAARLVEPDDLPALREAIEEVLTNTEEQQRLSAAGKEQAARFTWAEHARKTLDLYHKILLEDERNNI